MQWRLWEQSRKLTKAQVDSLKSSKKWQIFSFTDQEEMNMVQIIRIRNARGHINPNLQGKKAFEIMVQVIVLAQIRQARWNGQIPRQKKKNTSKTHSRINVSKC